jgi:hypothetical protein
MPETTGNKSVHGLHAKTEPIGVRRILNEAPTQWIRTVVDKEDDLDVTLEAAEPWPGRFNDAWKWFALSGTYLFFAFLLAVIGLVMTKGLMLIWEAWLNDLGK